MDEMSESGIANRRQLFLGAGLATAAVAGSMVSGRVEAAPPAAAPGPGFPMSAIHGVSQARSPTGVITSGAGWRLSINPDKSRTVYSVSRSPDGASALECMQSVAEDWRPIYGVCRLFTNGRPNGVITKFVDEKRIRSIFVDNNGVIDKRDFPAPPQISVGFHSSLGDGWYMNSVLLEPGRKQKIAIHTSSATWNASTLGHGETLENTVEYVGDENTSVGGLTLPCRVFLWYTSFGRTIKVWTYGEHYLLARQEVLKTPPEFTAGTIYSLTSLEFANL